jgi:hypothetical protein
MTLLERARGLIQSKSVAAAALAIIPLAANTARATAIISQNPGHFNPGSTSAGFFPSSGGSTVLVGTATTTANPDTSVSLSGGIINLSGATYQADSNTAAGANLSFNWSGTLSGNIARGETFDLAYLFNIALQPGSSNHTGTVDWNLSANAAGAFDNFSGALGPSGIPISQDFSGSQIVFLPSSPNSSWNTTLNISWFNFDPNSLLTVNIPGGSTIDESIVPEPCSLGLLGMGAIGLLQRRRRRV